MRLRSLHSRILRMAHILGRGTGEFRCQKASMRVFSMVLLLAVLCSVSSLGQSAPAGGAVQPLSPAVRDRVLDFIAGFGIDRDLPPIIANALGLSASGQTWPYKEMDSEVDLGKSSGSRHIFAINRGAAPDLVIALRTGNAMLVFRTRRDGQVVTALSWDTSAAGVVMRTPAEAQADLNAEFSYWTRNVDGISEWTFCDAELKGAHPVSAEKKIANCTLLIQSGKLAPANLSLAYVGRSRAYDSTQAGKILEDRNQAVKADPSSAPAWAALCSSVNYLNKEGQGALQDCAKAIVLDPKLVDAWTYRGDIYLALKQYDLAIADYNHAIELNSTWMWPWVNRGEAYLRENQIDRAIQDFEQVIKLNPDYAMGFLDRGIARMNQNNIDAALADFQTGLKVDPQCGSCYVGQGLVKQLKGDGTGGSADITRGKALSQHAVEDFAADGIAVP